MSIFRKKKKQDEILQEKPEKGRKKFDKKELPGKPVILRPKSNIFTLLLFLCAIFMGISIYLVGWELRNFYQATFGFLSPIEPVEGEYPAEKYPPGEGEAAPKGGAETAAPAAEPEKTPPVESEKPPAQSKPALPAEGGPAPADSENPFAPTE